MIVLILNTGRQFIQPSGTPFVQFWYEEHIFEIILNLNLWWRGSLFGGGASCTIFLEGK